MKHLRPIPLLLLILITHHAALVTSLATTVTGSLTDISLNALDTTLLFSPTNDVLLTTSGLDAGPPQIIQSVSGQFSISLDAGDYTVTLPLIAWRKPFVISVFNTNQPMNITNLLAAPRTYTYTNNLAADFVVPNSITVNGPLTYYDWLTMSNGVLAIRRGTLETASRADRAFSISTPMARRWDQSKAGRTTGERACPRRSLNPCATSR
jgi:hypothetical protein